jgi:hypothetical protein
MAPNGEKSEKGSHGFLHKLKEKLSNTHLHEAKVHLHHKKYVTASM